MPEKPITYKEETQPTSTYPGAESPGKTYPVGPTRTLPGSAPSMILPGRGGNTMAASMKDDAKAFADRMSIIVSGAGEVPPVGRVPYASGTTQQGEDWQGKGKG